MIRILRSNKWNTWWLRRSKGVVKATLVKIYLSWCFAGLRSVGWRQVYVFYEVESDLSAFLTVFWNVIDNFVHKNIQWRYYNCDFPCNTPSPPLWSKFRISASISKIAKLYSTYWVLDQGNIISVTGSTKHNNRPMPSCHIVVIKSQFVELLVNYMTTAIITIYFEMACHPILPIALS